VSLFYGMRRHVLTLCDLIEDQAAVLDGSGVATVIAALTDAADWHEYRASLTCTECAAHPAELCDEHGAALDAAGAYRALARALDGPA
jgi:hypothetical protein